MEASRERLALESDGLGVSGARVFRYGNGDGISIKAEEFGAWETVALRRASSVATGAARVVPESCARNGPGVTGQREKGPAEEERESLRGFGCELGVSLRRFLAGSGELRSSIAVGDLRFIGEAFLHIKKIYAT